MAISYSQHFEKRNLPDIISVFWAPDCTKIVTQFVTGLRSIKSKMKQVSYEDDNCNGCSTLHLVSESKITTVIMIKMKPLGNNADDEIRQKRNYS